MKTLHQPYRLTQPLSPNAEISNFPSADGSSATVDVKPDDTRHAALVAC
jgi:hypothetical protein